MKDQSVYLNGLQSHMLGEEDANSLAGRIFKKVRSTGSESCRCCRRTPNQHPSASRHHTTTPPPHHHTTHPHQNPTTIPQHPTSTPPARHQNLTSTPPEPH